MTPTRSAGVNLWRPTSLKFLLPQIAFEVKFMLLMNSYANLRKISLKLKRVIYIVQIYQVFSSSFSQMKFSENILRDKLIISKIRVS